MFAQLMPCSDRGNLIFIEDTNVVYQQAQHLKQVSLGKLSAGIVREIKEPMESIYKIANEISLITENSGDKKRQLALQITRGT